MKKEKSSKEFYDSVAMANEGVTAKDVKQLFIWYDLLSYALPFQIIFIMIYAIGIGPRYYAFTVLSVLGILVIDSTIKNILEKDATKFALFNKYISLVKLWAIPLLIMGICTTGALLYATFSVCL